MINKHATHISDRIKPNKDAISFLFLSPESTPILVIIIVYSPSACNIWLWIMFLLDLRNVFRRLICAKKLYDSCLRYIWGIRNYIFFSPYISCVLLYIVFKYLDNIKSNIMLYLILEKRTQYLHLALFKWSL